MPKTPTYRKRKNYDQAIVTLSDSATGKRRDYWLGRHGSAESREAYHRVIAEWESAGRRLPAAAARFGRAPALPAHTSAAPPNRGALAPNPPIGPTVSEIIREYWRWAKGYYRPNEVGTLRVALRLLRRFHGRTPAESFGPKGLRLLRDAMIRGDEAADPPRKPWSRVYVNQQTRRIRQMFRWAASHEMVDASVHLSLATIEPLKRGRSAAREGRRVGPAPAALIEAARPYMSRQVAALVDLQLLTGARPGELLQLRASDLDRGSADGVWTLRLAEHKTAGHGRDRVIYFGPAAQRVLSPFVGARDADEYLFSPAEAEAERRARLTASRKTPRCCGNRVGTNRVADPRRAAGARYTTESYYRAVRYACDRAFPPPEPLRRATLEGGALESEEQFEARLTPAQREELAAWRAAHRWHPHQLRHSAATAIRREFGLEAAQLILGHSSALVTDAVYAERDGARAAEVARRIG